MFTIGQVSDMFHIPISTLRYYDKEGLFPGLERASGIRRFGEAELEALRVIECLKQSGLEIKDIKRFMQWCCEGSRTYPQRKALFEQQRRVVEGQIRQLERTLAMIDFKCWYYGQAIQDGNEERSRAMMPDHLPPEIQKLYDDARNSVQKPESPLSKAARTSETGSAPPAPPGIGSTAAAVSP